MRINVGERLAWFRNRSGHTQDSLAVASKLSRQRISAIERNKGGSPSVETLETLLNQCGCTLEEFFREPQSDCEPTEKSVFCKLDLLLKSSEEPFVRKLIDFVFDGVKNEKKGTDA